VFGGTMMNERDIMETYLSKIPSTLSTHETKSEKELRMQEAQVKVAEFKVNTQAADRNLENLAKRKSIEVAQSTIDKNNLEAILKKQKAANSQNAEGSAANGIVKDADGNITVNYGKNVLINSAQVYNPKTKLLEEKPFVVVNRKILKDGSQQLIGFVPPTGMSKIEALQASYAPKDLISTPLTKTNYTNLNSVYVSKPFNEEFARRNSIAENLASENAPDTKQPTPAPEPKPVPAPTPSAKIQVNQSEVRAKAKAKGYNYDEYKDFLEKNGYVIK
jgi:hypothetical protein